MELLIWVLNDRVLSRTTPRLLTWGEGETEELSMERGETGLLGECGFGANEDYLGFVTVEFEKVGGEPGFDFL